MVLVLGLVLAARPARASNLLVNPGFESTSGHAPYGTTVAPGWTYFSPPELPGYFGDYWVQTGTAHGLAANSGANYWSQWSALNNGNTNVAGIYQTFSSSPGSIYQASGWISAPSGDNGGLGADALTWIQVEFLDVNTNLLALYKSDNYSASVGYDTWFQYQVTNVCDLTQPVSGGDPYFTNYVVTGSVSQLVAPSGTTAVRYRYALLQTVVKGSADLDDAVLNQVSGPVPPVINNLFPQNMIFVNPASNISFNVSSPSGFTINNSGIHLTLNGIDVSGSLVISGSASSKNVTYSGLQSNSTYTASISATDVSNLTVNASTFFQTMWFGIQPITYLWEAEDWDFTNGMYINNPDLCNAPGDPFCYFGKVGVQGVDENNTSGASGPFRPGDPMGTKPSGDYLRPDLFAAGATDYKMDPFNGTGGSFVGSEWVNYTRDWPNSTNWIIARLATDISLSGSLLLSQITPTATNNLGTFTINGGLGYTTYEYVYLKDTNGNNAIVVLNGTETLRVTSGGNLLPNFYVLVPAVLDLPLLSSLYPTGTHPFEPTNALSFTVTTLGATFPANGIKVILDGNDVSSGLVITGSASAKNVVYPTLQLNAVHTAIIIATNSLGHGIAVTNQFDTFSQSNYMFEAEDFDYNGGQFVSASDWYPDVYAGYTSVTNIDFQHTYVSGEPTDGSEYQYRINGIPQELAFDYLRQVFIDSGAFDYHLYWFGATDWANYTRVYPTGNFYVYARSAGLGPYTMNLDRVVSGAGTTDQTTTHLGQWSAVGIDIHTNAWVPLTDAGQVAPVAVKLGGTNTLRVSTTTGDCYPNYFMLVQVSSINLSATRAGNNININFPTVAGSNYRAFYTTDLTTGNWTLLNTVLGDGTVKFVSDSSAAGNQRFYKVTSP
ncbi:MAG TPA: hypothetical protein VN836_11330 [Verrucomicrobiae bacterium]|nr:hypothetical protein [Verrucomicrobiae bacterium]